MRFEERTQRLRQLVELAGLTQVELAQASGCSQGYISQMLNGRRRVSDNTLAVAERLARSRAIHLFTQEVTG